MTEHNWPCKRRGVDRAFRTLAGARSSWGESPHQRVWSCPWRPDRTRSKAWQTRQDGGGPRWTSPWCSDETDLVTNSILSSWIFFLQSRISGKVWFSTESNICISCILTVSWQYFHCTPANVIVSLFLCSQKYNAEAKFETPGRSLYRLKKTLESPRLRRIKLQTSKTKFYKQPAEGTS